MSHAFVQEIERLRPGLVKFAMRQLRNAAIEGMGMDTADVCRALAISASNCWVMHHRVRMRLRACPEIHRLAADAI
jgi:hypothetical protein